MTRTAKDSTAHAAPARQLRRAFATAALLALAAPAHAVCTFGAGGGSSLQGAMDARFGAAAAPDVTTDCVSDGNDANWQFTANPAQASIVLEFSAFAGQNGFSLYDPTNQNAELFVFHPNGTPGTTRTITVTPRVDGRYTFTSVNIASGATASAIFNSTEFGFVVHTPEAGGTALYSDSDMNAGGLDHLYAYQGSGQVFTPTNTVGGVWQGVIAGTVFNDTDYILAWEETAALGDRDYDDMVILVRNVTPVPLPPAAWLLGSGLIALGGIARRRRPRVVGEGSARGPLPA